MRDAISRTALLRKTRPVPSLVAKRFGDEWQVEMVTLEDIIDAPSLDVAPVIYCKDCSHARPLNLRELMVFDSGCFVCTSQYGAGTSYPEYEMTGKVVFPKSFCSYAHRRTNGR